MIGLDVHIIPTNLRYQSRLDRMTRFLRKSGHFTNVEAAGISDKDLPAVETLEDGRVYRRFNVNKKLRESGRLGKTLDFLIWYLRIAFHYLPRNVRCINAHTISVLPLCWLLSLLKGCTLVYEPHELETETIGMRGAMKPLARLYERLLIGRAACVITVNGGIAEWYAKTYQLSGVQVIRNLPQPRVLEPLPANYFANHFGFSAKEPIFLYQGLIAEGRGIELLLRAFEQLPHDRHIVFLGFGAYTNQVLEAGARKPNIHYHPPVPSEELLRYSACADVGTLLYEASSLNNYYSYSNKYCDYLTAGIPVLFSDFLWLRQEVNRYGSGWPAPMQPDLLARLILTINTAAVAAGREGARKWACNNSWTNEERILDKIYSQLFAGSSV